MGYQQRFNKAKQKVRKLAKEYSNLLNNDDIDWEEMKEMIHIDLSNLKHQVYTDDIENKERNVGMGEYGHEERLGIYHSLKNEFHKELRKFPKIKRKESKEKGEEKKEVTKLKKYKITFSNGEIIIIESPSQTQAWKKLGKYDKNAKIERILEFVPEGLNGKK